MFKLTSIIFLCLFTLLLSSSVMASENVKMLINLFADENQANNNVPPDLKSISELIRDDMIEAFSSSDIKMSAEIKLPSKDEFLKLTGEKKFTCDFNSVQFNEADYLLLVNIGLMGEDINEAHVSASFFSKYATNPYMTFEKIYTRDVIQKLDTFILNSITELEVAFSPLNKIIESKELPVVQTVSSEKTEILIPSKEKIKVKISNLSNTSGENVSNYGADKIQVAVKLSSPSYGTLEGGTSKDNWNVISYNEGDMSFFYIPPADVSGISQILVKDVIEVAPVFNGKIYDQKIQTCNIILRKKTENSDVSNININNSNNEVLAGNLKVNLAISHSCKPSEDYIEIILLINDKPLKGAKVEVFSFDKSKEPPIGDILKGTLSGGIVLKEEYKGYYCAGKVPVFTSFGNVNFYEGGNVILNIKYDNSLLAMKSFVIPSFSVKVPAEGKIYSTSGKLKAYLASSDKSITQYTWYNYKSDNNKDIENYQIKSKKQNDISVTFKPFAVKGSVVQNILRVKADMQGMTDIQSPDGFWVYTISNIKEVKYKFKLQGKK